MRELPYLIYALNNEGRLVNIMDPSVENGDNCKCFCPHCKTKLCAKNKGTKNTSKIEK